MKGYILTCLAFFAAQKAPKFPVVGVLNSWSNFSWNVPRMLQ